MKEWNKTVSAKNINDTGIIAVTIYHPNRMEAQKIAGAVNYVLMTQYSAYVGAGDTVKVRLIDQPISSTIPVKPNIPVILGSMVALGLLTSLVYIYLSSENDSLEMLDYKKNNQPAFIAHTTMQNDFFQKSIAINNHPPRTEQPEYTRSIPPITPYGQHARVSLEDNLEPLFDEEMEEMIDPDTIVRQGNMQNLIQ